MAHMTYYAPDKSLIYKTEDFVCRHKLSYWAITLYYQIVSLFDIIIDMGERIAGKQNRPSLNIEAPPPHTHQIAKNINFLHPNPYMKKLVVNCFPCWDVFKYIC